MIHVLDYLTQRHRSSYFFGSYIFLDVCLQHERYITHRDLLLCLSVHIRAYFIFFTVKNDVFSYCCSLIFWQNVKNKIKYCYCALDIMHQLVISGEKNLTIQDTCTLLDNSRFFTLLLGIISLVLSSFQWLTEIGINFKHPENIWRWNYIS